MINFDNSATSFPKPAEVKKAVLGAMERYGGNPGRSGHKLSIDTAEAVYSARSAAAEFFGAEPDSTVFAMNCTHALNMAIKGAAEAFGSGTEIIISSLEHNSVLRPVHALAQKGMCSYKIAEVTADDAETAENFRSLMTSETKIIVCTLGSNVTGQAMPYRLIADICRRNGICFIADGAQACGVIPVKLSDGINILCTAGHKSLYGPSGTGLLMTDGKYPIKPMIEGGTGSLSVEREQPDFLPDALESGTINTAGAIGLGAGINFVNKLGVEKIFRHENALCEKFISGVKNAGGVKIYRSKDVKSYLPIVSFNIDGLTSNEAALKLSGMGFALRGGLHCSGLAHRELGTLPDGTVRFSPSVFNTEQEVSKLVSAVKKIARE